MTARINTMSIREFAESVFSNRLPPDNPFIPDAWIGVAFDRNRYEELAPLKWWGSLTSCSSRFFGNEEIIALAKAPPASLIQDKITIISNSEKLIFEYLDEDARFLEDQYLIGGSGKWACLLDQDVSLFGGDEEFMAACFSEYGGRSFLLAQMRDDFLGEDVSLGTSSNQFILDFESYFHRLLRPDIQL